MSLHWLLQQIQPRVQNEELASAFEQTFSDKLNIDTLPFFILLGLNAWAPVGLLAQKTRQPHTTVKLQIASTCPLRDRLGY